MSHRRGAPSLDSYATERREWYHTMQLKLYQSPPEPDTSDDESTSYCIDTARRSSSKHRKSSDIDRRLSHMISMNSTVDTLSDGRSDTRSDIRSDTRPNTRSDMKADTRADSKQNSRPNTQSSYTSFLATLAHETEKMASKPQSPARDTDSFLSGERKIREFDSSLLDKSLLRLNSPKCPQATLVFLMGFNDNGLVMQDYVDFFTEHEVELISFVFPGRLYRVDEPFYHSVSEYLDLVLATLAHHGIGSNSRGDESLGGETATTNTMSMSLVDLRPPVGPPFSIFGHNLGAIIGFELARELERSTTIRVPLHRLIVSAARPPQALSQFNRDEKSRKYHKDSDIELINRMITLGMVPPHLQGRRDILRTYVEQFRADYKAMETYRLLRSLGKMHAQLECDMLALCGSSDRSVSERLLNQWQDMTEGYFASHVFDKAPHFYWMHDAEHEAKFLDILIKALIPGDDERPVTADSADSDSKSAANSQGHISASSSVTMQESFGEFAVLDQRSISRSTSRDVFS